jgi:hypothetical protein
MNVRKSKARKLLCQEKFIHGMTALSARRFSLWLTLHILLQSRPATDGRPPALTGGVEVARRASFCANSSGKSHKTLLASPFFIWPGGPIPPSHIGQRANGGVIDMFRFVRGCPTPFRQLADQNAKNLGFSRGF